VSDFLSVLIELFSLGVTAKVLRVNIGWKTVIFIQQELVDQKFHVEGVAPTNHSSSQKTRLNDLSYGIKSGQIFLTFLSQSTHLTDRWTEFSSLDHVCTACSVVKIVPRNFLNLATFPHNPAPLSYTNFTSQPHKY